MKIKKYFPKPTKLQLVQAMIDLEILKKANEKRLKDGVSWRELIEACLKAYLEE